MARKVGNRGEATTVLLRKGLRRRGMTDAEIDAAVRKKKRRRVLEFNVVKSRHLMDMPKAKTSQAPTRSRRVLSGYREPEGRAAEELCTVHFAADQLKLHRKTVLRFIREGRLPAKRVGKSYRIKRSDLAALGGLPADVDAREQHPSMTSIVDVPKVSVALAKQWQSALSGSLNARPQGSAPMRAEVIHEPERAHLKIIVIGAPSDTVHLLSLIRVWLEQLKV
jgi:excisionase family DNA binding protein